MSDTNIRPGTKIVLADGQEVEIYPVSLKQLRSLREAIKDIDEQEDEGLPSDETINAMVNAAQIILKKVLPDVADDFDEVEELVDIKSFNIMIAAAMGADPNELTGIPNLG